MRRVRVAILVAGFVGVIAVARAAWPESQGYVPPKGFVPDAVTASRIVIDRLKTNLPRTAIDQLVVTFNPRPIVVPPTL